MPEGPPLTAKAMTKPRKNRAPAALLAALIALGAAAQADAIPLPVQALEEQWTPTRARSARVLAVRMDIAPSVDDESGTRMWIVDETAVVLNEAREAVTLDLLLPDAWSAAATPGTLAPSRAGSDFWGEVFVNGRRVESDVVGVALNPAHPGITYRNGRQFSVSLGAEQSAHVRMRYALPAVRSDAGEERLVIPFRERTLWEGAIDFGTITVRWMNRMFALRTNLPSYAAYGDRVEWFLRAFSPEGDLELRFLPHSSAFAMVAEAMSCPTVGELTDRLADSDPATVDMMLEEYPTDVLEVCAALPAALGGSAAAARSAGLDSVDLSRFAPEDSGISGPLVEPVEGYSDALLSPAERMYRHYLLNEIGRRR
jgi:hypothetical protein